MTWRNRDEATEGNDVGGRRPDIQSILQLTTWAAEPAFLQRVFRGQERLPVSGDELHCRLAIYLTSVNVIQSFRENSVKCNEHFKKRLYAVARQATL